MQNFGQSVSFLYNYIREAHPNPDTAPCGPTEELGWNHPSWNTTSIEERAQRARWLKTDFNLTYPFIMDNMNNEMMAFYRGSRFYSGWVIDCDDFILSEETWGWATPETQWCGLRLADNDDLIAQLTQYLFQPPLCFDDGPPKRVTRVIPAVSRVDGFNNTVWRSDVVLANPHETALDIELTLRGLGEDLPIGHITLDAGSSIALPDVVDTMFETEGTGSLWIEADRSVIATARIANQGPDGAFGQMVRGLPPGHAVALPMAGHLFPLEESSRQRTNIGLTNVADGVSEVQLRFFDGEGLELGARELSLGSGENMLLTRALRMVTSDDIEGARVEIMPLDEESAVIAYASVVDNISGDPTFIEAAPHTYAWDVVLPGVAKNSGADDTQWLSEVALVNRNPHGVLVDANYLQRDGGGAVPPSIQITLEAGEVRVIHDPVATLFGRDGSGAIVLNGANGIAASGRTFNTGGPEGTFGQLVSGMDLSGEAILRNELTAHLIGLEESPDRRTNIGLVNPGSVDARARIHLFDDEGNELGLHQVDVRAGEFMQLDRIFRLFTDDDVVAGRAEITLANGEGRLAGYASTIDLGTGDPVYQPFWINRNRQF
ncbi:MAG: hypothetical protein KAJ78_05195 [Acidobacteria bacterium]|nr:hypothetical protein [Acidobacteriota bacterium]